MGRVAGRVKAALAAREAEERLAAALAPERRDGREQATQDGTVSVLLAGVGGQGSITATAALGRAALAAGLRVVTSEVHGMSQRGGSVVTTVRFGGALVGPAIPAGEADYLVGFERLEALRQLGALRPGGTLLVSDQRVLPAVQSLKRASYPEDLAAAARRAGRVVVVPALALALEEGSPRLAGSALLGALSVELETRIGRAAWSAAIERAVPAGTAEANLRAFKAGAAWARAAGESARV